MQLLQTLPISLVFIVLSTVVNGVPIQSGIASADDDSVVWVTETVWPCKAATSTSLAVASDSSYSVSRGTNQKKADYETVPVDGSDNTEAVPQEATPSDAASSDTTNAATSEISTELAAVATAPIDPTTDVSPLLTSSEILVYTAVNDDSAATISSSSETTIAAEMTSLPVSAMPQYSAPSADPVLATKTPVAYAANTTYTTPHPTMPLILPTFAVPNNGTNTTCTALPEPDEYTPEEESAYWLTATEPSVIYSDYTVMVTMKSTSIVTISDPATVDPAVTTTTTSVSNPNPAIVFSTAALYSNTTATTSGIAENQALTYTLDAVAKHAATQTSNSSATAIVTSSADPSSAVTETEAAVFTSPVLDSPTPTSADPSMETISGTVITYVDVTTTISSGNSTTTILETVTPTPSGSSDVEFDTTTTTTQWVTSTIIVDASATANAKVRRRILVTRG